MTNTWNLAASLGPRLISLTALFIWPLSGLGEPARATDPPVTAWLGDAKPCLQKAARAIVDSGRPYPNEIQAPDGARGRKRLVRYDLWLADSLYEMPGVWAQARGHDFFPNHHPMKYVGLTGASVETVLGIEKKRFSDPKVAGTIYGEFVCQLGEPPARFIENRAIYGETHGEVVNKVISQARLRPGFTSAEVNDRKDIGMAEITVVAAGIQYVAAYVPYALTQMLDGKKIFKTIGCTPGYRPSKSNKFDPDAPLSISATCSTWLFIRPGIYANIGVYQQYLPFLPAVHEKLLSDLESSKRN